MCAVALGDVAMSVLVLQELLWRVFLQQVPCRYIICFCHGGAVALGSITENVVAATYCNVVKVWWLW